MDEKPDSTSKRDAVAAVRFHYLKSPSFRTLHVDGAVGGPTPSGGLHIAFYAERFAIPQVVEQEVRISDGMVIRELEERRVTRGGVVREIEVDAILDLRTAVALKEWLQRNIEEIQAAASGPGK